jgi:hypothetical protein
MKCKKCGADKDDSEFTIHNKYTCKSCVNEYQRNYYHNGYKEKHGEIMSHYRKTDRGKEVQYKSSSKYQKTERGKESLRRGWKKYLLNDVVKDRVDNGRRIYRGLNPLLVKIGTMLTQKRRLGFDVRVTREELYNKFNGVDKCYICGCELDISYGKLLHSNSISFDRINNSDIINIDSMDVACHRCNSMKQTRTMTEYIKYLYKVSITDFVMTKYNNGINFNGIDIRFKAKDRKRYIARDWSAATIGKHIHNGFNIKFDKYQLLNIYKQTPNCPICGCNLQHGDNGKASKNSPSMDRIDNDIDLDIDDVWIICYECNATKRDLTLQQFKEYADKVCKRFNYPVSPAMYSTE